MFRFRLQDILDIRKKAERNLATQLVKAVSEEQAARGELEELQAARTEGMGKIGGSGESRPAGELISFNYLIQHLNEHIETVNVKVVNAETAVLQVQKELTVAHQRRRALDRLKERQGDEHRAKVSQLDRKVMDEFALLRHTRRGNE